MDFGLFAILLSAGLAGTMTALRPSDVNPGYFQSTLLVNLGLIVVGGLAATATLGQAWMIGTVFAGALTYAGFFLWQIDRTSAGRIVMGASALVLLALACIGSVQPAHADPALSIANTIASSAILGTSMGAMLLGHYYLTAPWMSLTPVRALNWSIFGSALVRGAVAGWALYLALSTSNEGLARLGQGEWILYFALRWGVGVVGPAVLALMVWQILRLKATQAATGVLYVIVIFSLLGEATGVMLQRLTGVTL